MSTDIGKQRCVNVSFLIDVVEGKRSYQRTCGRRPPAQGAALGHCLRVMASVLPSLKKGRRGKLTILKKPWSETFDQIGSY